MISLITKHLCVCDPLPHAKRNLMFRRAEFTIAFTRNWIHARTHAQYKNATCVYHHHHHIWDIRTTKTFSSSARGLQTSLCCVFYFLLLMLLVKRCRCEHKTAAQEQLKDCLPACLQIERYKSSAADKYSRLWWKKSGGDDGRPRTPRSK